MSERKITKGEADKLLAIIKERLTSTLAELGYEVKLGTGRYSDKSLKGSYEIWLPGGKEASDRELFELYASFWKLEPDWFGKPFVLVGTNHTYVISGVKPASKKYPLVITRQSDGKRFKANPELIRSSIAPAVVKVA